MFLVIGLAVGVLRGQEQRPDHRLRTATTVLHEILSAPDKGIPEDLLAKAQCVMIVPGLKKGAFIVGGEYGRGFALCRSDGQWGGPAAIKFGGGSFGAQIGGESTDVVMLVMNRRGMEKLATDKFTIGGDASAAAGRWDEPARRIRTSCCTRRFCRTRGREAFLRGFRWMERSSARTAVKTANSMVMRFATKVS